MTSYPTRIRENNKDSSSVAVVAEKVAQSEIQSESQYTTSAPQRTTISEPRIQKKENDGSSGKSFPRSTSESHLRDRTRHNESSKFPAQQAQRSFNSNSSGSDGDGGCANVTITTGTSSQSNANSSSSSEENRASCSRSGEGNLKYLIHNGSASSCSPSPHHHDSRNHQHLSNYKQEQQQKTPASLLVSSEASNHVTTFHMDQKHEKQALRRSHTTATTDKAPTAGSLHVATVVAHLPPPVASRSSDNNSGNSSSGGEGDLLVEPHKEPGFHKIRKTFQRIKTSRHAQRERIGNAVSSSTANPMSSQENNAEKDLVPSSKKKKLSMRQQQHSPPNGEDTLAASAASMAAADSIVTAATSVPPTSSSIFKPTTGPKSLKTKHRKKEETSSGDSSSEDNNDSNGGTSSGSGTEEGYAGSASSNENVEGRNGCGEVDVGSSSPSVSSSDESPTRKRSKHHHHTKSTSNAITGAKGVNSAARNPGGDGGTSTTRQLLSRQDESNLSMSSDIADFSSGATDSKVAETMKALRRDNGQDPESSSAAESITSNDNGSSDEQEEAASASRVHHRHQANDVHSSSMHHNRFHHSTCSRHHASGSGDRKRRVSSMYPRSLQMRSVDLMTEQKNDGNGKKQVHIALDCKKKAATRRVVDTGSTNNCKEGRPKILMVGSDVMAHVLTFLEPPEIMSVLTMPLSKGWVATFTRQRELWRVLCLLEPFKAQVEEESDDEGGFAKAADSGSDDDDFMMMDPYSNRRTKSRIRKHFGKFRLMYTSFVRCMKYLARIKDDALNGRPPSMIDYGDAGTAANGSNFTENSMISSNQNLQSFFSRARVVQNQRLRATQNDGGNSTNSPPHSPLAKEEVESLSGESSDGDANAPSFVHRPGEEAVLSHRPAALDEPIGVSDDGSSKSGKHESRNVASLSGKYGKKRSRSASKSGEDSKSAKKSKPKYGPSMLTRRLLLPASTGETSNHELPWSCAIYSIVNWMVGFADVEGIQTMCLKVLPLLLEDEQQRMTAQRAGLTDVILRDMVLFPDSPQLHTAAFHTIVLLARPLGGSEGMLFHTSMVNSSGIFNSAPSGRGSTENRASARSERSSMANGKNGIAVMLDSMRRFQDNEMLQAMSCWSLVNIALAPAQKEVLVKLGGIEVATNAMISHPYSAEVQFRALFSLINLVIPKLEDNAANQAPINNAGADGNGHQRQPQPAAPPRLGNDFPPDDDETFTTEKEVLDSLVGQIVLLVVRAMRTFCSSESILNRACLVLHNLSLREEYHGPLLWTPHCYQMLEWCMSNYREDQVLQQSAAGTLHRLQVTLSSSEALRRRFNASMAAEQQVFLEQAHREAVMLQEQYEQALTANIEAEGDIAIASETRN